MKTRIVGSILAAALYFASSTVSTGAVLHIWSCKLNDGKTGDDLVAVSSAWLEAARGMDGGADLSVYIDFPLAANAGDGAFSWVLEVADAKTWGVFMDGYDDSPAAEADEAFSEVAACSGSSMWNSIEIE